MTNINCDFEDLFACSYNTHTSLGLQWNWAKFSQLVDDDQGIDTGMDKPRTMLATSL